MGKICGTFASREEFEAGRNGRGELGDGSCGGFAEACFDLGEDLFDGIEIRAVGREVRNTRPACLDRFADARNFVNADVVHDDDVAGLQRWRQHLLDIGLEAQAVHRPVEQKGRGDAVMAQGGDEGCGLPMAKGDLANQAFASRRSSVAAGHVCRHGRFIDEDKPCGVKQTLFSAPQLPRRGDVWPILFGRVQDFF
jgi:hypothetical protein